MKASRTLALWPLQQEQSSLWSCVRAPLPALFANTRACSQSWKDTMQHDTAAYASLLRSFGNSRDLQKGMLIHDHLRERGLDVDPFLGSLLVQMYANSGALADAHSSFVKMHDRDAFSWNFMIRAYARHGNSEVAFQLFEQMQQEGVMPNKFILASLLSACACQAATHEGLRVHARIRDSGLDSDVVVGTALLNMYGKYSNVENAEMIFHRICERDPVCWNAMIAVYAHDGQSEVAFYVFDRMLWEGVMPNKVTYISVIDMCATKKALAKGKLIHVQIMGTGLDADVVLGTTLINMYGGCRNLVEAWRLFDGLDKQDVALWNTMISVCVQQEQCQDALQLFNQMHQENVLPDEVTYVSILSACSGLLTLGEGKRMHTCIVGGVFGPSVVIRNALVSMYGKCGKLNDARSVFDGMCRSDVISWNAMIAGYAFHGQDKMALQLFHLMQQERVKPNKVTIITILNACTSQAFLSDGKQIHVCIAASGLLADVDVQNAIVSMYGRCGSLNDALKTFKQIFEWNTVSFVSILSACTNQGALVEGKQIHAEFLESKFEPDMALGTSLVNFYGKCGSLEDAQRTFEQLPERDVYLWTAMIALCAQHRQAKPALLLFDQMQDQGVKPNHVTILTVLSACNHAGLVEDAWFHLNSMQESHGISPIVDHYNCMVDLLAKVGMLDEAEDLINNMPFEPTDVTWTSLLHACKTQNDVRRANRVAIGLLELNLEEAAPYMILLNIYVAAGREDDAAKMMKWIRNKKLRGTSQL